MQRYRIWNFLAHCSAILAGMFIIFFSIDRVNPAMDFLTSPISKWTLLCFAVFALCNGVLSAAYIFRKRKQGAERAHAAQRYAVEAHSNAAARPERPIGARQRQAGAACCPYRSY